VCVCHKCVNGRLRLFRPAINVERLNNCVGALVYAGRWGGREGRKEGRERM